MKNNQELNQDDVDKDKSEVVVRVKNLKKHFNTPAGMLHAVDGVSFEIKKGKTLGIVGESGCGKSTTGRAILQVFPITGGDVEIDGIDMRSLNKKELRDSRKRMQMIFQDPYASLNPRKNIYQIIEEPLLIHNLYASKSERREKVEELMKLVGLSPQLSTSYPHELDGGRRQRAVIARALSINPKFIVCDEPVSALDVSIQAQILNLLQDLQEKLDITYIFITHDLSVVKHISHEIAVMYLGKIVEKATPDQLFSDPIHPYTKALLSAIPVPDIDVVSEEILLQGEISSPIEPKDMCLFSSRCVFATDHCRSSSPQLVDVHSEHMVSCHRYKEIIEGKLEMRESQNEGV